MTMKFSVMLAGVAAMCVGAVSTVATAATAHPGGAMGVLTPFPALYGHVLATDAPQASFSDDYAFVLSTPSDVTGSVGVLLGEVSFRSVMIDGLALPWHLIPTGQGFSLAQLTPGEHTLTVTGSSPFGDHAYVGSLYAVVAAPEPESVALAVVAVGLLGWQAKKRGPSLGAS
jgi:hypothetical protein